MDAKALADVVKRQRQEMRIEHPSHWTKLKRLIKEYAESVVQDSWKGGGDPHDFPIIEKELELATLKLNHHLSFMESHYDDTKEELAEPTFQD